MEFSHNEEFYTASLMLLLLAMKHRESVVRSCSIPIYDWADMQRREVGRLEGVLGQAGEFDVYGGPDRNVFESQYHFDPDIIVAGPHVLMLIEAKKSPHRERTVDKYLEFVVDPRHPQANRWILLMLPEPPQGWFNDNRREFWENLRRRAADRAKIGWLALDEVVTNMQNKIPHERKYPGIVA